MPPRHITRELPIILKILHQELRKKGHHPHTLWQSGLIRYKQTHTPHHKRHITLSFLGKRITIEKINTGYNPTYIGPHTYYHNGKPITTQRHTTAHDPRDPNFNIETLTQEIHNWLTKPHTH